MTNAQSSVANEEDLRSSVANEEDLRSFREVFLEGVDEEFKKSQQNTTLIKKEKYHLIIKTLQDTNSTIHSKYKWKKKFMVVRVAGEDILFKPKNDTEEGNICFDNEIEALLDRKQYVHTEQLFGIIHSAHRMRSHVKSWNLHKHLQNKYVNIPRNLCELYVNNCSQCNTYVQRKKIRAGYN